MVVMVYYLGGGYKDIEKKAGVKSDTEIEEMIIKDKIEIKNKFNKIRVGNKFFFNIFNNGIFTYV